MPELSVGPIATMAECYGRVVRAPREGTASAAIVEHSAACGLVAYVFGVHPDQVARAVADAEAGRASFQAPLSASVGAEEQPTPRGRSV
jgi:hypothetical protein